MNPAVPFKVQRNGLTADITDGKTLAQGFIKDKLAEISGKDQQTAGGQMTHGKLQQPCVIPLHIKDPIFFFGIGVFVSDLIDFWEMKFIGKDNKPINQRKFWHIN